MDHGGTKNPFWVKFDKFPILGMLYLILKYLKSADLGMNLNASRNNFECIPRIHNMDPGGTKKPYIWWNLINFLFWACSTSFWSIWRVQTMVWTWMLLGNNFDVSPASITWTPCGQKTFWWNLIISYFGHVVPHFQVFWRVQTMVCTWMLLGITLMYPPHP